MAEEHIGGGGDSSRNGRNRYVTGELRDEILVRLPVKTLIRFESVCKTWRSLFHSPAFIELYAQRRRAVANHSFELYPISLEDFENMVPEFRQNKKFLKMMKIGESWKRLCFVFGPLRNGIYCITSHYITKMNSEASIIRSSILSTKIVFFNPSTRDYKIANPFPRNLRSMLSKISLNNKQPCHIFYGFGNVESDCRVVVLIQHGRHSFLVLVYSFQSRDWRKIIDYEPDKYNIGPTELFQVAEEQGRRIKSISYPVEICCQSFLKGCCHWTIIHQDSSWSVMVFNLTNQSLRLVAGPSQHYILDGRVSRKARAFVLHDHLAMITRLCVSSRCIDIRIWMMMEYGVEDSWAKIYAFNPNAPCGYPDAPCGYFNTVYHVYYRKNEKEEEEEHGGKIKYVLLRSKDLDGQIHWNTPGVSTYIESLERL